MTWLRSSNTPLKQILYGFVSLLPSSAKVPGLPTTAAPASCSANLRRFGTALLCLPPVVVHLGLNVSDAMCNHSIGDPLAFRV